MAGNKGLSRKQNTRKHEKKATERVSESEREREQKWRKIEVETDRKHIERYICLQRDDGNTKEKRKAKLQ